MRIEGRIKIGYYPTPETVVEKVKSFLGFPEKGIFLDPCCGEGKALQQFAEGTNAATYGVELDKARAMEAEKRLGHVLCCDYQQTRIAKGAFSLLWLNPPYDDDEGKRLEFAFLQNTACYLRDKGILVYIIPQKRLNDRIARYLASYFEEIRLWRFPDPEYEGFGQLALLAKKRNRPAQAEIPPELADVPNRKLPVLEKEETPLYEVPAARTVSIFRSTEIDPAELEAEIGISALWERILKDGGGTATEARTPLPLHRGHLGLLLAAGKLDGVQGTNGDRHLVRGKITKVQTVSEQVNEDGSQETHILESFRVAVKMLTPDGAIRVLA